MSGVEITAITRMLMSNNVPAIFQAAAIARARACPRASSHATGIADSPVSTSKFHPL